MNPVEVINMNGVKVEIYPDGSPESPREWDNFGLMVCFHRGYVLGDPVGVLDGYQFNDPQSFTDWLRVNEADYFALPLYLYDHSGLSMSTRMEATWWHKHWDAGQVGYIIVSREDARTNWGWKRISKKREVQVYKYLRAEVEVYDQWLRGDVYGFMASCEKCGEELDSCWGFFGSDWKENGVMGYIPSECGKCGDVIAAYEAAGA